MVTIRRVRAADVALLRRLRLAALRDAPDAFESEWAAERAFPAAVWRERAASNEAGVHAVGLFAVVDGAERGLAVGILADDAPDAAKLVSLWVDPACRRRGAARALVEGVCTWAGDIGCRAVVLEVTERNHAAAALYRACGFVDTGVRRPYRRDAGVQEIRMARPVG